MIDNNIVNKDNFSSDYIKTGKETISILINQLYQDLIGDKISKSTPEIIEKNISALQKMEKYYFDLEYFHIKKKAMDMLISNCEKDLDRASNEINTELQSSKLSKIISVLSTMSVTPDKLVEKVKDNIEFEEEDYLSETIDALTGFSTGTLKEAYRTSFTED